MKVSRFQIKMMCCSIQYEWLTLSNVKCCFSFSKSWQFPFGTSPTKHRITFATWRKLNFSFLHRNWCTPLTVDSCPGRCTVFPHSHIAHMVITHKHSLSYINRPTPHHFLAHLLCTQTKKKHNLTVTKNQDQWRLIQALLWDPSLLWKHLQQDHTPVVLCLPKHRSCLSSWPRTHVSSQKVQASAASLGRIDPSLAKAKLPRLRIQDPVSVIFDVPLFFIL